MFGHYTVIADAQKISLGWHPMNLEPAIFVTV